ncbi:hypothetical protein [Streptomyces sp. NPDC058426]|uniref:hypothetical protein n=1 Tax=Streptomyces sp. NPDC058426 TaxID=3346493 RepID=UPI00365C76DB
MNLTVTGLFTLVCVALGAWIVRKAHHKKREVIAVSLFWILLVATPYGADGVAKIQELVGNGVKGASDTVNSVSR